MKTQRIKKRKTNDWFPKTRCWTCKLRELVHRQSDRLMRSGKTSNKNNLSCYDHELIPVCPSSEEPSKSFSSQPSLLSHPGHYCTDKTCTCQGSGINNWCWMKTPPSLFLLLSSPLSLARLPVSPCWHISSLSRSPLARRQQLVNPPTHRLPSLSGPDGEIKRWHFPANFPVKIFHRFNFTVHCSCTKDIV